MEKAKERKTVFFVNKNKVETTADVLKGSEILSLAGLSADQYDLFLVKGQQSQQIQPDQQVDVENGMHFNAIVKGATFG